MHCEICGKHIFDNSHYINGKYYHNDCIERMASSNADLYYAEYSLIQSTFHIDKLDRIIEINKETISKDINTGYQIIGFGSYEECLKLCERMENVVNENNTKRSF